MTLTMAVMIAMVMMMVFCGDSHDENRDCILRSLPLGMKLTHETAWRKMGWIVDCILEPFPLQMELTNYPLQRVMD